MSTNETPKETFERILYKTIAPALEELHTLCHLNKAPEAFTQLFHVGYGEEGSIRTLIDRTTEEHPVKFLE
jgi:hypothetical protein